MQDIPRYGAHRLRIHTLRPGTNNFLPFFNPSFSRHPFAERGNRSHEDTSLRTWCWLVYSVSEKMLGTGQDTIETVSEVVVGLPFRRVQHPLCTSGFLPVTHVLYGVPPAKPDFSGRKNMPAGRITICSWTKTRAIFINIDRLVVISIK